MYIKVWFPIVKNKFGLNISIVFKIWFFDIP